MNLQNFHYDYITRVLSIDGMTMKVPPPTPANFETHRGSIDDYEQLLMAMDAMAGQLLARTAPPVRCSCDDIMQMQCDAERREALSPGVVCMGLPAASFLKDR